MRKYLLPIVFALTAAVHAAGPDVKYRTPRTPDGQPDLQGVWNFSSNVPLERPTKFADTKFFTKDEIAQRAAARDNALKMVATFAPVEDVGVQLLDHTSHVDDLRTSLITYPENGRLPALVDGVRRLPGVDQILEALGDLKSGPPAALAGLLMPSTHDTYGDFSAAERCLIGAPSAPIVPDL